MKDKTLRMLFRVGKGIPQFTLAGVETSTLRRRNPDWAIEGELSKKETLKKRCLMVFGITFLATPAT